MDEYNDVLEYFSERLKMCLYRVPDCIKSVTTEIRVKVGEPVVIITTDSSYYLTDRGVTDNIKDGFIIERKEFNECIKRMCGYSFFAYENQINNGYITLKNGHRVGICGSFSNTGCISSCDYVFSLNVRISRYIKSFGKEIADRFWRERNHLLISGKPATGKTTLIRDIASCLSDKKVKVCVADERNEIAANCLGERGFSLGAYCDIISNCPKRTAAEIAIRSMSPDVLIFDEISFSDCDVLQKVANSGVTIIATFHSFTKSDNSYILNKLLDSGFHPTVLHLGEIGKMPDFDYSYAAC